MVTTKRTTALLRALLEKDQEPRLNVAGNARVPSIVPENARLLELIVKLSGAKKILEIGTAAGFTSMLLARAAGPDARVYTIESFHPNYELARKNIQENGLDGRISILFGDAEEVLAKMNASEFDLIFLDGPKSHYIDYLNDLTRLLADQGVLVCDNVLFRGMIAGDKKPTRRKETIIKKLRWFLEALSSNKALKTSVIPIGDGLSISYKGVTDD